MKKIGKSSEFLWILGIVFVALGVAICNKADLGVSMIAAPAFVLSEALSPICDFFSVGTTEYVFQGLLLIIMCILCRKFDWRYLLAFGVAVAYGYSLNFFLWLFDSVSFDTVIMRWIMLIVGDITIAFGIACFFRTYLPLQVYELFVSEFSTRFGFRLSRVKWTFDMVLLCVSLTLALTIFGDISTFDFSTVGYSCFHNIGLGTLVTTAINSPLIALMGKLVDLLFVPDPRFPKLEKALKIK